MTRWLAATVALSSVACGYQVVRGDAPFGAHRIAVEPFNEDQPVGLAVELTEEISRRLAADGVRVVRDAATAQGVLSGSIVGAQTSRSPTARFTSSVPAYRVAAQVQATLRATDGTLLWSTRLSATEDFLESGASGPSATAVTEANRRRALQRMATRLADELHQRLTMADASKRKG